MEFIRFKNDDGIYAVNLTVVSEHVLSMEFEKKIPENYLAGFYQLNKNNNIVEVTYEDFNTLYRAYKDKPLTVEVSDDGTVYVEPEPVKPIVKFYCGIGGTLKGDITQSVNDFSELIVPTPTPDENYKFVGWTPEIPKSGEVDAAGKNFTAIFEYVPTLDEVKTSKIAELSSACQAAIENGVDIEVDGVTEHFSYKSSEDQSNIKELFDTVATTGLAVFYHCDGGDCKLYTPEQIFNLYGSCALNKTSQETYFNQLRGYIGTLETKEEVTKISFGVTKLTGKYLETYNAAMAQAKKIFDAVVAKTISANSTEGE